MAAAERCCRRALPPCGRATGTPANGNQCIADYPHQWTANRAYALRSECSHSRAAQSHRGYLMTWAIAVADGHSISDHLASAHLPHTSSHTDETQLVASSAHGVVPTSFADRCAHS